MWDAGSGLDRGPHSFAAAPLLTLTGHTSGVPAVAFSPDGRRIVTGSDECTVKLWDTRTARDLLTLKGHAGHISSVAFSPDGRRLVTGSDDNTAKVWEAASPEQIASWAAEEGAAEALQGPPRAPGSR